MLIPAVLPLAGTVPAGEAPASLSDVDAFNAVLGTQTIGAEYQFTEEPRLVETARAILAMGSNVLKFRMSKEYAAYVAPNKPGVKPQPDPAIRCLADLAQEPAHRHVFEMPFAYYSYSSYDSLGGDAPARLKKALDHIESKLPPRDGLPPGKRVWIGEYGFPADKHLPAKQDELSRRVMKAGLEWGCPFVLYWELYSNERKPDGKLRGFWLIDDQNVKQPVYHTHQRFLQRARAYVAGFKARNARLPTADEFRKEAVKWME